MKSTLIVLILSFFGSVAQALTAPQPDYEQALVGRSWCFEDVDDDGTYGRLFFDIGNVGVSEIVGTKQKPQVIRWSLEQDILTIQYPRHKDVAQLRLENASELTWTWLPPSYGVSKVTVCR